MKKQMAIRRNYVQQKYAEKLKRDESRSIADAISERFPGVSGISVRIIYHGNNGNPVLMVRTVNYFPSTDAYFVMQCFRKECTGGGFDLGPKISGLIKNKERSGKGKMECKGSDPSAPCKAGISFEINVQYKK